MDAAVHAVLGRKTATAPFYSADANAAIQAYEAMRERGWRLHEVQDYIPSAPPVAWKVRLLLVTPPMATCEGWGNSFASALCAAIVEAGKRLGERERWPA